MVIRIIALHTNRYEQLPSTMQYVGCVLASSDSEPYKFRSKLITSRKGNSGLKLGYRPLGYYLIKRSIYVHDSVGQ